VASAQLRLHVLQPELNASETHNGYNATRLALFVQQRDEKELIGLHLLVLPFRDLVLSLLGSLLRRLVGEHQRLDLRPHAVRLLAAENHQLQRLVRDLLLLQLVHRLRRLLARRETHNSLIVAVRAKDVAVLVHVRLHELLEGLRRRLRADVANLENAVRAVLVALLSDYRGYGTSYVLLVEVLLAIRKQFLVGDLHSRERNLLLHELLRLFLRVELHVDRALELLVADKATHLDETD
jgi:hypothetical protein